MNLLINKKKENKMIDTIRIYLDNKVKGVNAFIEKYYIEREPKLLKQLHITVRQTYIIIEGSITKYVYGNNSFNPSFTDIQEALIEIGEKLGINIMHGKIQRIDIAHNFVMSMPVALYILEIWSSSHTNPHLYDTGIQLRNKTITMSFYDKIMDGMKKNNVDRATDEEINLFRYELQIKKNVSKKFGNKTIFVEQLFDSRFCQALVYIWFKYFMNVKAVCNVSNNSHYWINSKDISMKRCIDNLAVIGFNSLSPKEKRILLLAAKANNDRNVKSRLPNKINSLSKEYIEKVKGQDLWKEISEKVHRFYRKQMEILKNPPPLYNKVVFISKNKKTIKKNDCKNNKLYC